MTKKHIIKKLTEWVDRHPDCWNYAESETPHFWWVQNSLGDLLGWPKWYGKFIAELEKKNPLKS